MIVACATDDKSNLIKDHFGDAKYYNIYNVTKGNTTYIKSVENTIESNIHPDPSKAKKILDLLHQEEVELLVNRTFGTNLKIIKKYLTPMVFRIDKIEDVLNEIEINIDIIDDILKTKKDVYLVLKIGEEVRTVETTQK